MRFPGALEEDQMNPEFAPANDDSVPSTVVSAFPGWNRRDWIFHETQAIAAYGWPLGPEALPSRELTAGDLAP